MLLFLSLVGVGLVLYVRKYNWYAFSYLMSLFHGDYTGPGYTLFSPSHLLDFLNQQILVSPIGLALLVIFLVFKPKAPGKEDRIFQFLLIVSIGQLLFNLLIDPGLGAARDWDLFASVGLGYTLLALYIFSRLAAKLELGHLKLRLTVVALLFTLPWILINASGDLAVAAGGTATTTSTPRPGSASRSCGRGRWPETPGWPTTSNPCARP